MVTYGFFFFFFRSVPKLKRMAVHKRKQSQTPITDRRAGRKGRNRWGSLGPIERLVFRHLTVDTSGLCSFLYLKIEKNCISHYPIYYHLPKMFVMSYQKKYCSTSQNVYIHSLSTLLGTLFEYRVGPQ